MLRCSDAVVIRLKEICKDRDITINKLATLSGLRQSTLNDLMSGTTNNPKLITLYKIATGLDMTISELLDFDLMNTTIFEDE